MIRILRLVLLSLSLLALPGAAAAQTAPADTAGAGLFNEAGDWTLNADQMLGQENVGGVRHILRGVTITQKTIVITAPRGYYYPSLNMTSLGGGVRLVDRTLTVLADSASYFRGTQILQGTGGVNVLDRDLKLSGDTGSYDRRNDLVTLDGNIRGDHQGRLIQGDRLVYDRRTGQVDVTGNARVDDPAHNSVVKGRRIIYEVKTGVATLAERPALDWRKGKDEVHIEGDEMRFLDNGNRFRVRGNVVARQGRQTATSDSAYFLDRESLGFMYGNPRVTDPEGDMTGDSLALHFEGGVLNRATMKGHAQLVYVPSDPQLAGERSVIHGDSLTMFFENNTIGRLTAYGSPGVEYQPSRADSAQGTGRITASADTLQVLIENQAVDRVELQGKAAGKYFYHPGGQRDSLDRVDYSADRITFHVPQQNIVLRGAGQTDYHELTLKAQEIDFDAKKETLVATPNPVLIDKTRPADQNVVGQRVNYSLVSSRGTIYHGRTQYENGFILADSLRKVTETEFNANSGQYTTCDLVGRDLEPHYHFTSGKMKIYLGDKVVARPVVLYIGKIPIFALPFYVFSIRKGRHSGLLLPRFEFGFTGTGSRFFDNLGYYWAPNDYTDYLFSTSYREDNAALIGDFTGRYAKTGLLNGELDMTHVWSNSRGLNQIRFRHAQTFGEDFRLSADTEFGDGDVRFLRRDIGTRTDRLLRSNAGLSKSWRTAGISMQINASQTKQLDASLSDNIDEVILDRTFPRVTLSLSPRTVGHAKTSDRKAFLPWLSRVSYNLTFSGSSSLQRREHTTHTTIVDSLGADSTITRAGIVTTRTSGAIWTSQLRDQRKLLGFIDFIPNVSLRENWVDREFSARDTVKGFRRAATYSLGVTTGTTVYGTFHPKIGPLRALRHTMNPQLSLSYNPEFRNLTYADSLGRRFNRFPGVGGVASQVLNMSVENRFQAKVASGETEKRIELFTWSFSGSYDMLAAKRGALHPASNIQNSIVINRIKNLNLQFSSSHNPYHQLRIDQFTMTSSIGFSGRLPGSPATEVESAAPVGTESAAPVIGFTSRQSLYETGRQGDTQASDALNWRTNLGFSYSGYRVPGLGLNAQPTLSGTLDMNLTRNWAVNYTDQFQFKRHISYHRIELRRDLHCWQASFSYETTAQSQQFYFRINVKSLPDIKFESGPGFGALETLSSFAPGGSGF